MHSRFSLQLAGAGLMILGAASTLLALVTPPAGVHEAPVPGTSNTQYTVTNSSSAANGGFFDIDIFLSTTTGSTPTTTNSNWTAEVVTAADWTDSMGFPAVSEPANLTWQQYTGMTYTQAYLGGPIKVNGYYLDYTYNSGTGDVTFPRRPVGGVPGAGLGGFFFAGSPSSTFFVAGPADATGTGTTSFTAGSVVTYTGTSVDVPEPASLGLVAFAVCGLSSRRGWRQVA